MISSNGALDVSSPWFLGLDLRDNLEFLLSVGGVFIPVFADKERLAGQVLRFDWDIHFRLPPGQHSPRGILRTMVSETTGV